MTKAENRKSRRARAWSAPLVAIVTIGSLGACESLLEVENPNNLVQEDIESPVAGNALSNGSLSTVSRGVGYYMVPATTGSDELVWIGSRDAWGEIDRGNMSNPFNEFTDLAFQRFAEGRWMSDEAVNILSAQDADGTIIDRSDLARAYLWSGIVYNYIADWLEDFPFSNRGESRPPIGASNMDQVYDQAIERLTQAISIAGSEGDDDIETWAVAQRARAKHGKAVWQMLEASGTPSNPLVGSGSGAEADALAALQMIGASVTQPLDQRWEFVYSSATVPNDQGWQVNERLEHRFGDRYVVSDNGTTRTSTRIQDPIDDIESPVADAIFDRFEVGGAGGLQYAPNTVVSVRELLLIVAESKLAAGDDAGFVEAINGLRSLDSALTPYDPATHDAKLEGLEFGRGAKMNLLIQARLENLVLQGRLLNDHYRFGFRSDMWQDQSEAVNQPGTVFPISAGEMQSNECLNGQGSESCGG